MDNNDHYEQEQLVRSAAEQSRLLPDENPDSLDPGDIRNWISVYTELLGFKSNILAEMKTRISKLGGTAATEISQIDVALVELQQRRYQGRLKFWEQRARQVASTTQMKPAET